MNWQGVDIYGASFDPYCQDVMHSHSENYHADAMLSLMDLQVFNPQNLLGTKWIAWTPVDHQTIPPVILEKAEQADFVISMSKHASAEMDKAGLKHSYIPCGVDTSVFKPYDMRTSREDMKLPTDKFIVGMVAMNKGNPSRKAFHQTIMAFAALKKNHSDCVLYLHTGDGIRGYETVNLIEYIKAFGLSYGYAFSGSETDKDVIFANQYGLSMGYEPQMMAKLYSAMDVYSGVTMGEGFGIPIIEAQACGTPVIVGDWTSMPELCFSGWKVERDEAEPIFTPLASWHYLPHPAAIADRMEAAYQMRGNQDYRKRAKAGVQQYDIERLIENKWLPVLKDIGEKLASRPVDSKITRVLGELRHA